MQQLPLPEDRQAHPIVRKVRETFLNISDTANMTVDNMQRVIAAAQELGYIPTREFPDSATHKPWTMTVGEFIEGYFRPNFKVVASSVAA